MSPTLDKWPRGFREVTLDKGSDSVAEVARGARMPRFVTLPTTVDPTSILSQLRVVCLGVGAVGRNSCLHLARLGVGTLWICDRGRYKPESLLTQPADPDEVGRPKAEVVGRLAKRLSPSTTVYTHFGPFETLGPRAFAHADLVVMATDNIRAEIECGQQCVHLGKPLIQASVHGGTITAQVRFYSNKSADGPCPACALTTQERTALGKEVIYSCDGAVAQTEGNPTTSTSHLCALAGDLAVNQLLRFTLSLGADVMDQEIEWNGFTMQTHVAPLQRSPSCPADHVVWTTRATRGPVADSSLRDLARSSGIHDDRLDRASFRVGEAWFVQRAACRHGHSQPIARFIDPGKCAGACATCGESLVPEPYFRHDVATGRLLHGQLDRPLRELCKTPPDWVVVRENETAVLYRATLGQRESCREGI